MKKRILSVILSISFLLSQNISIAFAASPIIKINRETLETSVPPVIENGTTLVPMRDIFEYLGATVEWFSGENNEPDAILAYTEYSTIVLTIGNDTAYLNNLPYKMPAKPKIVNNTTMVPLRFIAEAFDCNVFWNEEINTVSIYKVNNESLSTANDTQNKYIEDNTITYDKYTFVGDTINGEFTGEVNVYYDNDLIYCGEITNYTPNGNGTYYTDYGYLEGTFVNGKLEGSVTSYLYDTETYTVLTYLNGKVVDGNYKSYDKKNNYVGRFYYTNGDVRKYVSSNANDDDSVTNYTPNYSYAETDNKAEFEEACRKAYVRYKMRLLELSQLPNGSAESSLLAAQTQYENEINAIRSMYGY